MTKKYLKTITIILISIIFIYILIYIDVILRARSAFLEGEKYWSWYENPEYKRQVLDREFQRIKEKLDKNLKKGKIDQKEYERQIERERFIFQQRLNESSIKYAYIWYQTVIELFSPPESKWVRLARKKMPIAKEKWKQELISKGIPFEDYMLE